MNQSSAAADPIGQIIALAAPRSLMWKQLEAAGDWGIRFPANDGVVFCYLLDGSCRFEASGIGHALGPGDFVLMVRPPVWTLSSRKGVKLTDYAPGRRAVPPLRAGRAPQTRVMGGRFVLEATNGDLLKELLPARVLVRGQDETADRVRPILDRLGDEAKATRPGQGFALERLMDLLLVEIVRSAASLAPESPQPPLLRALATPAIARALQAIHSDVARRWTVAALAKRAGMSRSSFAAGFTAAVGRPPIDYLLDWHMALAKRRLQDGRSSLSEIATGLGYSSAAAFSAAFRKRVGCPPSTFAARLRVDPEIRDAIGPRR